MAAILVLALILLLFTGGFAMEFLWYVAVAALILWVVGFLARGSNARWYRW